MVTIPSDNGVMTNKGAYMTEFEKNERIEQGKEPSIEDVKKHMKETNNESFYQAREQMRNEEYGTLPPGYSSWGMYWKSR
jgi:hypothetical protein